MRATCLGGVAACVAFLLISCSGSSSTTGPTPTPTSTPVTPVCAYAISSSPSNVSATGGTGSITVTLSSGPACGWNAKSDSAWLTLAKSSGSGSDSIAYTAIANSSQAPQVATITLTWSGGAPATATVTEAAPPPSQCSLTLSTSSQSASAAGGSNQFGVNATAACGTWQAVPTVSWIHISNSATGSGNQFVNYTVDANSGASRSGGITVSAGSSSATVAVPQDSGVLAASFVVTSPNRPNNNCDLTADPAIKCTFDASASTGAIAGYEFDISANNGRTAKLGTAKVLPSQVSVSCNNVLNAIVTPGSTSGAVSLLVKITLTLTSISGQTVTSSPTSVTLFFGATRPCGL